MSAFTSHPGLTPYPLSHFNRSRWYLETPLVYEVGRLGSNRHVVVSKGFVTDHPKKALAVREYLYRGGWIVEPDYDQYVNPGDPQQRIQQIERHTDVTPRQAEAIWREAMKAEGVPFVVRWLLWLKNFLRLV